MRVLAAGLLLGCASDLNGNWSGDCEFEDLVGPDGRFMELIYRLDLSLDSDGLDAVTGEGRLYYTVNDVDKESGFSLTGETADDEVQLVVIFDEELNDLVLNGDRVASDEIEGDCVAGVAEGDFRLLR